MSTLRVHFRDWDLFTSLTIVQLNAPSDQMEIYDETSVAMEIDDDSDEAKRVKRQHNTLNDEVTPLIELDSTSITASRLVTTLGLAVFAAMQKETNSQLFLNVQYQNYLYFQNLLNANRFHEIISYSQQINNAITFLQAALV